MSAVKIPLLKMKASRVLALCSREDLKYMLFWVGAAFKDA